MASTGQIRELRTQEVKLLARDHSGRARVQLGCLYLQSLHWGCPTTFLHMASCNTRQMETRTVTGKSKAQGADRTLLGANLGGLCGALWAFQMMCRILTEMGRKGEVRKCNVVRRGRTLGHVIVPSRGWGWAQGLKTNIHLVIATSHLWLVTLKF